MKKIGIIALLLLLCFPLFSIEVYTSNALSQKLDKKGFQTNNGYELVVDNNNEKLLLNGNLVQEKIVEKNSSIIKNSDKTETRIYDENSGLLTKIEINEASTSVSREFFYSNKVLSQVVETRDGIIESIINYQRDYKENVIASTIIEFGNYYQNYYNSKSLVSTTDNEILVTTFVNDNISTRNTYTKDGSPVYVNDVTFSLNEEEEIIISRTEGDKVEEQVFLPTGQIVKESVVVAEEVVSETSYTYIENAKTSSIIKVGNKEIESFFENEVKIREVEKTNGIITAERDYFSDGTMTEIAYRNNKQFAKIYYDVDKSTVIRIEILWLFHYSL